MRNGCRLAAGVLVLALVCALAPSASALVVHGRNHHFFGIQLHRGIRAASVAGSVAAQQQSAAAGDNGKLSYHGGPVVRSSAPYLIFWMPSGENIPGSSRALMDRYFTDVAADSGGNGDAFGVSRQYTDAAGFAGGGQTFNSSTQALIDTQPYPATDATNCPDTSSSYPTCITDAQLQQELQRLVTADGLPNDGAAGATELPQSAPIYFIVLPGDVNVCDAFGTNTPQCADNTFCAYHSSFTDGSSDTLLYAAMPTLLAVNDPKSCQADGNTAVQAPNGDPADLVINDLSHEDNETITDPFGTSWWDSTSGNEEADGCSMTGPFSSANETDPNSYLPTLGGSASTGTLYDQLIGGDHYYTQSEWSNSDLNCEMRPSAGTISPTFSETPAPPYAVGSSITFDPTASTSSNTISSETWDFGDGSSNFHAGRPTTVSHKYTAAGTCTVRLTLVDNRGNMQSSTQQITIGPAASFTYSPTSPLEGTSVSFDGSGSVDPDSGAQITSYAWNFGDGTTDTQSTATDSHTYARYGTYTVTLTVTDNNGVSNTTSHQVTVVDENPTGSFTISPGPYATGQSVSFNGSGSTEPDGTIASYAWNFGDGSTGSGATPSHAYTSSGPVMITLTVTDSDKQTSTTSQQITVYSPPSASFGFSPPAPITRTPVSFTGSGSSDPDPGVTISSYRWSFGDGTTGSGPTASHAYSSPANYTVTFTVTNTVGLTATSSERITIFPPPPTASFAVTTAHPAAGVPVQFNGSSSSAPQESITSYAWNFGDGSSAGGAAPAHTYARAGTYRVTLTITSSSGLSSTAADALVVVTSGRIKQIKISARGSSEWLTISLTGPGRLSVGARPFTIARAETIKVRVRLTAAERRRLQRTHRLTVSLPVAFTPQIGRPTKTYMSIRFRR